ncbi:TonB family protein [Kordiimonas sp.]|uniref:energy transducer TonB n=1 Tax=Kordiimonas sp. TaxID=1970157 RepID=UPI003A938E1F
MNTVSMRTFPIVGGAALSTFGLFFLMQGLVGSDMMDFPDSRPVFNPNIVLPVTPPEPVRKINRVSKPPEVIEPPRTKIKPISPTKGTHIGPTVPRQPPVVPAGSGMGPLAGLADGERIPLVRVQPQYPRRALERGIEGSVVVEFTVTRDGTVAGAHVIEAEPKGMFDREALSAIAKFKYKPKVVDGVAYASSAERYRFVFALSGTAN